MSTSRNVIKAHRVALTRGDVMLMAAKAPVEAPAASAVEAPAPEPAAPAPAPLDMETAQKSILTAAIAQSQEILETARTQAAEIVQAARDQAAEVTRQAHQAGQAAAEAEAAHLLLSAQGVLDEVGVWRDQLASGSEKLVLDLVVDIARALFGQGWVLDEAALHAAFGRALAEAKPLGALRIHVHPEDAALLGPLWPEQQSVQIGQSLDLVPDPSLRRGGCLVEGDFGSVDGRVETQLQLAVEAISAPPAPAPSA